MVSRQLILPLREQMPEAIRVGLPGPAHDLRAAQEKVRKGYFIVNRSARAQGDYQLYFNCDQSELQDHFMDLRPEDYKSTEYCEQGGTVRYVYHLSDSYVSLYEFFNKVNQRPETRDMYIKFSLNEKVELSVVFFSMH